MGRIIGIDLGTTTSEVAYIKNGEPEIIPIDRINKILPSVVALEGEEFIVGNDAEGQWSVKPESTVKEVKRLMGSEEEIVLNGIEFSPEEISAEILKTLRVIAERELGEEVTDAVITVPSNFNDIQKSATKKAGELAGLNVRKILNEPTAAALAYGVNNMSSDEKIVVYDLGGGTFDVTVLELFEGIINVKSSRGNTALGGKDFNEKLRDYILDKIEAKYNIKFNDEEHIETYRKITSVAEEIKKELSYYDSAEINIGNITHNDVAGYLSYTDTITKEEFESLIVPLIYETMENIDDALIAAGYQKSDIDVVLLVGGSSRIPLIKSMLGRKFKNIQNSINPDEAVALGAAVSAGIESSEIDAEKGLILSDVCALTLGVEVVDSVGGEEVTGIFDPIILRDTPIPCSQEKIYYTLNDNQSVVDLSVYQGENKYACENTKIREFFVEGIPPNRAGRESVRVRFCYNANGILDVTAIIVSTNKEVAVRFDLVKASTLALGGTVDINDETWKNSKFAEVGKSTIDLYEKRWSKLSTIDRKKADKYLVRLKTALVEENENKIEQYDNELTDILFSVR